MKKVKNEFIEENKNETKRMQSRPKRPDYSGKKVAVWINEDNGRKWLKIKINGLDEKFVAFENKE